MATVAIWKIKSRLDHVIDYTTDDEKTINEDDEELGKALNYIESDYKTEQKLYVTALNCSLSTAKEEMTLTKKQWNKTDGILGFHGYQSFKGNEATPDVAHQIGVQLANEIWGDRFEVVVSTHINTENIHNHFVVNSVSFKDGKKYYDNNQTYAMLRETNDSICLENGLSVLEEKTCKSGINYGNYRKGKIESDNYYSDTKKDVDLAVQQARSLNDFENILKAMNYTLIYRSGKISLRKPPYKRNIRIERMFGDEYTVERLKDRIQTEWIMIEEFDYTSTKLDYRNYDNYKKQKVKGIYGLYLHYCYLLKVYPIKYPQRVQSAEIKADVKLLEEISNQAIYLVDNKIETDKQLEEHYLYVSSTLSSFSSQRMNLWKKYNRTNCNDTKRIELKNEIDNLGNTIVQLRKEVRLCQGVSKRLETINLNIVNQYEKNQKEKEKK